MKRLARKWGIEPQTLKRIVYLFLIMFVAWATLFGFNTYMDQKSGADPSSMSAIHGVST